MPRSGQTGIRPKRIAHSCPVRDDAGMIRPKLWGLKLMQLRIRYRAVSWALISVVAIIGLGSRRFAPYLPDLIAAYTGDTAWALAVFLVLGLGMPRVSTWWKAAWALAISVVVELSQLYHAPWIDSIRDTTIGHLALGSGFDPRDLACYTLGVGIGVLIEMLLMRRDAIRRFPLLGVGDVGLADEGDQGRGEAVDRSGG